MIKEINIPSNVKEICEKAFYITVAYLKLVLFPKDSRLETINENAFSSTIIKEITIPSNVTKICKKAFYDCLQIRSFNFESDSKLQTIENLFLGTNSMHSFVIPSSVVKLEPHWFYGICNIRSIKVMPNLYDKILLEKSEFDSKIINSIVFCINRPGKIEIPNYIDVIDYCSFMNYEDVSISFQPDSHLSTIGLQAFKQSSIISFSVPPKVTRIDSGAFYSIETLQIIEFTKSYSILLKFE